MKLLCTDFNTDLLCNLLTAYLENSIWYFDLILEEKVAMLSQGKLSAKISVLQSLRGPHNFFYQFYFCSALNSAINTSLGLWSIYHVLLYRFVVMKKQFTIVLYMIGNIFCWQIC